MDISWGPWCFRGKGIDPYEPDPCSITVKTAEEGKWQKWFRHTTCFKERLATLPDAPAFLIPRPYRGRVRGETGGGSRPMAAYGPQPL
jgi:hypothetical protein